MNNTTIANKAEWEGASFGTYIFIVVCTTWTICANSVILVCFYRNRNLSWTSFSRLTCSMSVSDLLVGINTLPALIFEQNGGLANGLLCSTSAFLFFSTQCVTLYHVLAICIYRNFKLKTISDMNTEAKEKCYTYVMIVGSWSFSMIVILLPYVVLSKYPDQTMLCNTENIFGTNIELFSFYLALIFFSSQFLTNIIYVITCYRLWRVTRRIQPNNGPGVPIPSTSAETANTTNTTSTSISAAERQRSKTTNVTNTVGPLSSIIRSQKRVTVTIGILLLLFNVFTLPFTAGLFIRNSETTSRDVRYVISTLFVINSGINPIVYATRLKSLKQAMKTLVIEIGSFCTA